MSLEPLNFYAPILAEYIVSSDAKGDSDGAGAFLSMVAWVLETQKTKIRAETKKLLIESAKHVSDNKNFYDADNDIYGSFKEKYMKIEKYI